MGFKIGGYAVFLTFTALVLRSVDFFGLGQWTGCAFLAIAALAMMLFARYTHDYLDFPAAAMYNTDRFKTLNVHGCTLVDGPIDFEQMVGRFLKEFIGDEGKPVDPNNKRWVSRIVSNPVRWPYWVTPATVPALQPIFRPQCFTYWTTSSSSASRASSVRPRSIGSFPRRALQIHQRRHPCL